MWGDGRRTDPLLSEPRALGCHVGPRPRAIEPASRARGLLDLALGRQAPGETEERPTIVWVPREIGAVSGLGLRGSPRVEEGGAEHVAHRKVPVGRLEIAEVV